MIKRENLLEPEVEICKSMESFLESAHSIAKTEEKQALQQLHTQYVFNHV